MRTVRYSLTARDQLRELLALGVSRFGVGVVAETRDRVFDIVDNFLAKFPATKRPHPSLGLVVYPISDTPFLVLYDYDNTNFAFISSSVQVPASMLSTQPRPSGEHKAAFR